MKKLLKKSQTLSLGLLLALTIFAQAAHTMPLNGRLGASNPKVAPNPIVCPGEPAGDVCT